MNEVYRIKKGTLKSKSHELPFDFGLVFLDKGFYKADLYIAESYHLRQYPHGNLVIKEIEDEDRSFFQEEFYLKGLTEENNIIEIDRLNISNFQRHLFKFSSIIYGSVTHKKVRKISTQENKENKEDNLYYIEVEGLKMEFSDFTEVHKERNGKQVDRLSRYQKDHTNIILTYGKNESSSAKQYPIIFSKGKKGRIVISFAPANERLGEHMPYSTYLAIKRDLVCLLSFANGAEVDVRAEHIGNYYTVGKISSETTVIYSGKPINTKRLINFFSLQRLGPGDNVLSLLLSNCFDSYVEMNKLYDLNRLIFHINGANRANNIQERFFILIICLERLAKKYIDSVELKNAHVIDSALYGPVKQQLLQVLQQNAAILGDKLSVFVSKVHGLNIIQAKSTEFKFLKLLEHVGIALTPALQNIISKVRHESIHYGEIGKDREAAANYFELDDLLRLIIARLIGYNGHYSPYTRRYTSIGPK